MRSSLHVFGQNDSNEPAAAGVSPPVHTPFDRPSILNWLHEEEDQRLDGLYAWADRIRQEQVGNDVHLRGLVEISSHCVRQCTYCGLRRNRAELQRYRMSADEILACAHEGVEFGYGTVVLQAGEDFRLTRADVSAIVRRIKAETPLAITLSLGERPIEDLAEWRQAGADRYLLRFETSDLELFERIHPPLGTHPSDRIALLRILHRLGYEVGSGVMIGIPGQSYESLADDLLLFRELQLDMIGVGPFIAHSETPLGQGAPCLPMAEQVPNTEKMTYKVLALTRLACPQANIPSTSALATLNKANGRELGLSRGANVVMPNLTPVKYRAMYEIYPAKACIAETAASCRHCLRSRIRSLGRGIGRGPGSSRAFTKG